MGSTRLTDPILLADGDLQQLERMEGLLNAAGLPVVARADGDATLVRGFLARHRLLICDLLLPRLGGAELIERLHHSADLHPSRVLVTTAMNRWGVDRALGEYARHVHVLHKPFTDHEFVQSVERLLGRDGRAEARERPNAIPEAATITLAYASPEQFVHDYSENIVYGTVFVPTDVQATPDQTLSVEVFVPLAGGSRRLETTVRVTGRKLRDGVSGLITSFVDRSRADAMFESAFCEARESISRGRPLRLLVHGFEGIPEEITDRLPGLDVRAYAPGQRMDRIVFDGVPDLILARIQDHNLEWATRAIRRLRHRGSGVPVVVGGGMENEAAMRDAGADAYFHLPAEHATMMTEAARILEQSHQRYNARAHFSGEVGIRLGASRLSARGLNLSLSGMAFTTKLPIDRGRVVDLEIHLADDRPAAEVQARILWTEWSDELARWRVGVMFLGQSDALRSRVWACLTQSFLESAEDLVSGVRRHPRIGFRLPVRVLDTEEREEGECLDLSEGGLGIVLPRPLRLGRTFQLDLQLPDGYRLQEDARVRWMDESHPNGEWRHGLEFERLSTDAQENVRALVAA